MFQFKRLFTAVVITPLLLPQVHAQQVADTAPLDFQSIITSRCDPVEGTEESAMLAQLGLVLGQVAAKTVLGLATGALTAAAADKTVTRSALAPGYLYTAKDAAWAQNGQNCLVFWYGKVGNSVTASYPEIADDEVLASRWRNIRGFAETPYVYGEVRLIFSNDMSAVRLQPVRYFARPAPEFNDPFRKAATLAVVVDLKGVGQTDPFISHAIGIPSGIKNPINMSGIGLYGKSSGWFGRPDPGTTSPANNRNQSGYYTARVVATANMPGSKVAAALAGALTDDKDKIIDAIKPKTDEERLAASISANKAAFAALAKVEKAQAALDSADAKDKPELEIKLREAKYDADMALEAAGYPKRFNVSP